MQTNEASIKLDTRANSNIRDAATRPATANPPHLTHLERSHVARSRRKQQVPRTPSASCTRRNPMHPLHRAQQVRSTRVMAVTDHEAGVEPNEAAGPTLAHHESFTTHPPHERTPLSRWHVAPSPCIPQRVPRTWSRQPSWHQRRTVAHGTQQQQRQDIRSLKPSQ